MASISHHKPVFLTSGLIGDRPTIGVQGQLYFATDTGIVSLWTRSAWKENLLGSGTADIAADLLTVNEVAWGTPASATVVAGVLTVTGLGSYINLIGEDATTDTIDSVVKVGQAVGDYLLIRNLDTDVMTFDNSATLLLGDATRDLAVGGSIQLIATSATVWAEIGFVTTTT